MSEVKEEKIPKFSDKPEESFHLWRLRMEAVFENRDCMGIIDGSESIPEENDETAVQDFTRKTRATALMVLALGDEPLKVVQKYSKEPSDMWQKLTARYAGKSTSNKLSLLNEVFSKTLEANENITDHIGDLELCFTKLENAGQTINELMQVSVLLASIKECDEYEATVAAIRTMDEDKTTWETVTTRLIDEYKEKLSGTESTTKKHSLAAAASSQRKCFKCGKRGHIAADLFKSKNNRGIKVKNGYRRVNEKSSDLIEKPRIAMAKVLEATALMGGGHNNDFSQSFVIDSGATHHICSDSSMFSKMHRSRNHIQLGNHTEVISEFKGTIDLVSTSDNRWIRLSNVLYAPAMSLNLLSVPKLDTNDMKITIADGKCTLTDNLNDDVLARGTMHESGLYTLDAKVRMSEDSGHNSTRRTVHFSNKVEVLNAEEKSIWHSRLGHANDHTVREMMMSDHINGMRPEKAERIKCTSCAEGKQVNDPHKGTLVPPNSSVGDIIFVDLCGPMPEPSWGKSKYLLLCVDGASRYVWISLLQKKSEATKEIQRFARRFQNIYGRRVKKIHSDNGGEFANNTLANFLNDEGILHSFTSPYNPQSNGIVERMNRTIIDKVRCMLTHARLDNRFWGEAALTAVDIQNVIPINVLSGKTPSEVLNGAAPDLSRYRVFGCEAFVTVPKERRKKLDKKAKRMIFMGHMGNFMYRVFNPATRNIEFVRHARFNELSFPGYPREAKQRDSDAEYVTIDLTCNDGGSSDETDTGVPEEISIRENDDNDDGAEPERDAVVQPPPTEMHPRVLRRSTRNRKPNPRYQDSSAHATRKKPIYSADEPSLSMAMNSPERDLWVEAINKELTVLRERETWELVPRPHGARVLPSKFVLRLKRHADGTIDKYKARLVALGCKQRYGDYDLLYSPVLDFSTVRLALTISGIEQAQVHQMDVSSAFLHGKIDEDLYMLQPKGFEDSSKPNHVCKLRKSLYGLKQAPRVWYFHLHEKLVALEFKKLDHAESGWFIHL